ncbi:MAG: hypothetical protein U5Q03_18140 [Bacteroidota bacterium]|nr:hypothetical protein [Bacteroidota bacterium]
MKNSVQLILALIFPSVVTFSQTSSENYIHQQSVKVEGVSEADLANEEYNAYQVSENVRYY